MSFQSHKSKTANTQLTLEILVFRVAGQWFGLRGDRQLHLRNFDYRKLQPPSDPALAQLARFLGELDGLPVFDLAQLLKIDIEPKTNPAGQLMWLNLGGMNCGFVIDEAQAIQRVPLNELKLLPLVIRQLNLIPAVWAVWQRAKDDLIPLLDFNFVLDQTARQTLQPGLN